MPMYITVRITDEDVADYVRDTLKRCQAIRLLKDHEAITEGVHTEWFVDCTKKYRDACESLVDFLLGDSELVITTEDVDRGEGEPVIATEGA